MGHKVRLEQLAAAFRERGWSPVVYTPPDAPAMPQRAQKGTDGSFAEMYVSMGLADPEGMRLRVENWWAILGSELPDLVVADLAPHLLMAARDRFPTVAAGNGYHNPPADLDSFPRVPGLRPLDIDQTFMCRIINTVMEEFGRRPFDRLPEVNAGDAQVIFAPICLDPYRDMRTPPAIGAIIEPDTAPVPSLGPEIFVYASSASPMVTRIAIAEAALRLNRPRRVLIAGLPDELATRLRAAGAVVETDLVRPAQIAQRSCLVVHTGGMGLASEMIVAGIPQVSLDTDGEKLTTSHGLEAVGVARRMSLRADPDPEAIAALIEEAAEDRSLRDAARAQSGRADRDPLSAFFEICDQLTAN